MMTDNSLFNIVTAAVPTRKFTVDDQIYNLKDLRHLSPKDEARYRVLMTRDNELSERLTRAVKRGAMLEADGAALKAVGVKRDLIMLMTDLPREIVLGDDTRPPLHADAVATLIRHIFTNPEDDKPEAARGTQGAETEENQADSGSAEGSGPEAEEREVEGPEEDFGEPATAPDLG